MQVIGCAGSSKQELAMHCAARARSTAVVGDAAAPRVTHKRTQCQWCGCGVWRARDVFWASQAESSLVIMVAGTEGAGPEAEGERCVSDRVCGDELS